MEFIIILGNLRKTYFFKNLLKIKQFIKNISVIFRLIIKFMVKGPMFFFYTELRINNTGTLE